jgi:TonB-dependent receptor
MMKKRSGGVREAVQTKRRSQVALACGLLLAGASQAQTPQPAPGAEPPKQQAPAAAPEAAASAPATPAAPAPAPAPSAPAPAIQPAMVITVRGIRGSLESSLNLKRDARGVVDGIVAEDIGKFPDTNLAEAMQRISGVSIDRANGEGQRVTVRGAGPDYNLVLLNGRQMPTANIEGTAPSNSRAFDFSNLAAEAVSALEVYKTGRASTPTGGIGATINIRTARPLDIGKLQAGIGVKGVYDQSNSRLPSSMQGSKVTPEVSGIYSDVFADGTFGVAIIGSYQERALGFNQAAVPNGWRAFRGNEGGWGAIPAPGAPGSENITNRPGPNDVYSVPQNIVYSVNALKRERTNGQLVLQARPFSDLTATLDHTYSEQKIQTRRNELSAWFNFGPSSSAWTNGPVAAPIFYSETINPPTSDIAMGGGLFAVKNENNSTGLNVAYRASNRLRVAFDAHHSTAEAGPNSPFGSNVALGTASFNRGTTRVDFSSDFPVLSIEGSTIDPSLMQVTGSSFRSSFNRQVVDQAQFKGRYNFEDASNLDFGVGMTRVNNRSAYGFVQRDTWGGVPAAEGRPPLGVWQAESIRPYFSRIGGSGNPALFNNFFLWNFEEVRNAAANGAAGVDPANAALYQAPTSFSVDRRTKEESFNAHVEYETDWEWGSVPMSVSAGLRYEQTKVTSTALVPIATGVSWGSNNELSVQFGPPGFTTLTGKYSYLLPSIDFQADLHKDVKLRFSIGETLGRPNWGSIQGGQTLNQLARVDGGTGEQGNPGLKPLKSKNLDLSLEFYYAKGSYVATGLFYKSIDNFIGVTTTRATPFNLNTPIGGPLFNEAVSQGGCASSDLTCIRNYIFANYNGRNGVTATGTDANGNRTGTIAGQPGDPLANFTITTPVNQRDDTIRGLEFNWQHILAGTGLGVSANYTFVRSGLKFDNSQLTEQFALVGLGNAANLVGFYENDQWSVRVAYNWRDKFLASTFDGSGAPNPIYTAAYGQVDVGVGFKPIPNLTIQFEGINLNDAIQRAYGRNERQTVAVTQTGRRYMLGARYTF